MRLGLLVPFGTERVSINGYEPTNVNHLLIGYCYAGKRSKYVYAESKKRIMLRVFDDQVRRALTPKSEKIVMVFLGHINFGVFSVSSSPNPRKYKLGKAVESRAMQRQNSNAGPH